MAFFREEGFNEEINLRSTESPFSLPLSETLSRKKSSFLVLMVIRSFRSGFLLNAFIFSTSSDFFSPFCE
jgi:hypothetical protein